MAKLYHYFVEYFHHAPTLIQLSWILSAGFMVTIMLLITYLSYLRAKLRTKERIEATYQKKYESDLIEYLYAGNDLNEISPQQQQIIKYLKKCTISGLKRKIIIHTLLKLRNEISGETADAIQNLYYQTGLMEQAVTKLKHKKWDVVARAIKELSQFEIKEVHDDIKLLVNHPKKEVRNEIQKYLVKLFCFDGLDFLNVLENQLSEWDQIQLLEILQKADNQKIPDISVWLKSNNPSVISFAIKLARIFNQFETKDEILELFKHPNLDIRIQAIEVVDHLGILEAFELLKKDITERTLEEQIAFFKMSEKMCTTADIPFVMEFLLHENFDIRASVNNIIEFVGCNTIQIDRNKTTSENTNLTKAS
ncbi:hypothetical protein SLW70_15160 [Flavobacterium sp. NG2]|uniref:HEAT repeat domain-containing protein n=1 Tax=Flavobacterium sp. NG2 TaxID=3097547 RepID=UPI002A7EB796|nr:hypothetical protein [Flavobacterium sp. NG2]WPR71260.1 hypothetical protein SLW70_15160 [Flavobacterium sp. NG2]